MQRNHWTLVRKIALGETLTYSNIKNFLLNLTNQVLQSKNELNRMDAACGDGDFGTSMYVAFSDALKTIHSAKGEDIAALLSDVGKAILSSAGGAAGPIFGTLFAEAGKSTKSRTELGVAELATMFESSLRKIEERGGALVGDKTLLDVLDPAVGSLKKAATENVALTSALADAAKAAQAGYEVSIRLVARQGKARYLGAQTVGHPDPGAYVTMLMFETLWRDAN
jgi:phosphoenolpyruvate---glycerone phosphotransferase subunit DhaL